MSNLSIPFVKYTASGNNFVIVDETAGPLVSEDALPELAFHATNINFGIGCDNLLVIQRASREALAGIRDYRAYWPENPDPKGATHLFRMFEPDGQEAYCCGNGLMSIAHYLHAAHKEREVSILTEVPLAQPRPVSIGVENTQDRAWVNLSAPRQTDEGTVRRADCTQLSDTVDKLKLKIELRRHDLHPYSDDNALALDAYLSFTGEPHLVVFPDSGFSVPKLAETIFCSSNPNNFDGAGLTTRVNFGTWLLRRIGYYLNHSARELFPHGINVNLARVDPATGAIEYRTYERGIERETLACGTGAMAVAHVAATLRGSAESSEVVLLPHRCRWYETHTAIKVRPLVDGSWVLSSAPRMLCKGELQIPRGNDIEHSPEHDESERTIDDDSFPFPGIPRAASREEEAQTEALTT